MNWHEQLAWLLQVLLQPKLLQTSTIKGLKKALLKEFIDLQTRFPCCVAEMALAVVTTRQARCLHSLSLDSSRRDSEHLNKRALATR
jgi:hypothetical protein